VAIRNWKRTKWHQPRWLGPFKILKVVGDHTRNIQDIIPYKQKKAYETTADTNISAQPSNGTSPMVPDSAQPSRPAAPVVVPQSPLKHTTLTKTPAIPQSPNRPGTVVATSRDGPGWYEVDGPDKARWTELDDTATTSSDTTKTDDSSSSEGDVV